MLPVRVSAVVVVLAALLPAGASSAHEAGVSLCKATQLALTMGPAVSAATGQNPFAVRLTNRGRDACVLNGYPVVSFSDRRGALPLDVRQGGGHGGDQQVTRRSPRRVLIRPGHAAYVILNKYRCDLGTSRVATGMQLALPGSSRPVGSVSLRSLGAGFGYCKRVSTFNVVSVSPFVPSIAAALVRY
jgi:hypothetical protein